MQAYMGMRAGVFLLTMQAVHGCKHSSMSAREVRVSLPGACEQFELTNHEACLECLIFLRNSDNYIHLFRWGFTICFSQERFLSFSVW